jgi:hypothetical protein
VIAFCEQAFDCAERLFIESSDRVRVRFRIAGRIVELCGPNVEYLGLLLPAFAHLAASRESDDFESEPALRIYCWDSASTATPMLASPWQREDFGIRDRVRGDALDERWHVAYDVGRGTLSMFDVERRCGMCWTNDPRSLPTYELAAPLLRIWTWWLQSIGMRLVHGAAVGFPDGGVLLTARGGSGKSTTALNCLNSELRYAADDYCIVSGGVAPVVHSLFETGKLRAASSLHLTHLEPTAAQHSLEGAQSDDVKRIFHLYPDWSHKLIAGFPLRAILVPQVRAGAETSIERISAVQALRALAPSTLFQLGSSAAVDLRFLGDLVRAVPCFTLHLGSDLPRIPNVITALLRELGAGREVRV